MMDKMTFTLNSPITEEQWDMIEDVDFDHTDSITFHTKHGKEVEFVKRKTGEWVYINGWHKCSQCGQNSAGYNTTSYCPNCGARMEEDMVPYSNNITYEQFLRQQVERGSCGVAIVPNQVALDIANWIEEHRESKTGKWICKDETIGGNRITGYRCSECNWWSNMGMMDFCPNCGADMREQP